MGSSFLKATCLKSSYSLRRQLLLSFGASAILTLSIVVALASISSHLAGQRVRGQTDDVMRTQVIRNLVESSELEAVIFAATMNSFEGHVQLLVEATRERIAGYPDEGYEDDRHVPFPDMVSGRNKYPLKSPLPPLDWDINVNVNSLNAQEHLQERAPFALLYQISSESASYFIQGACDPADTNSSSFRYYPNCTEANNDMDTGGVLAPTNTSKWIHEKAADLVVFLKPLFESNPVVTLNGVYFHNSGAGATIEYPGNVREGNRDPYVSDGCDWMREINPHNGKPFATEEEIARCHPAGTLVHQREYNPVERPWFKDFVLNSGQVRLYGPFQASNGGIPIVTSGRAIFDRVTGHLIGCATIDVAVEVLNQMLQESRLHEKSELAIVRYDDGIVVADSLQSLLKTDAGSVHISETGIADDESFEILTRAVDFTEVWDPEDVRKALAQNVVHVEFGLVTGHPLPLPPKKYDPSYRPAFMVVHAISEDVFSVSRKIDEDIDQDVMGMILQSILFGVLGMLLVLAIVWCVSRMLTQPLLYMENVAWRIVNHTDKRAEDSFYVSDEDKVTATLKWTPTTEINELVFEFQKMIRGFSGKGASKVAESSLHEIPNEFTWQSDFQQLYSHVSNLKRSFKTTSVSTEATEEDSNSEHSSEFPRTGLRRTLAARKEIEMTSTAIVPAPRKRNNGYNLVPLSGGTKNKMAPHANLDNEKIQAHRSPLFWWILVLIVIPSLVTIATICTIVTTNIFSIALSWVEIAGDASFELELASLASTTRLKASLIETQMAEPIRNLYLVTRMAGWLHFGGIVRSESFTSIETIAEICKSIFPSCFDSHPNLAVSCACEFDDPRQGTCAAYPDTDSRLLQGRSYVSQARDFDPVTGRRDASTSFPQLNYSPETTSWWNNTSEMPGAYKGANASGYETTYDRVRVSSAMAIVDFPIYNYATRLGSTNEDLGTGIAFDADGLFTGYMGCSNAHAYGSRFVSSEENRAAEIAPELCPIGRFGFDPRCRDWYATGKNRSLVLGEAVHVTAPYVFASYDEVLVGVSATSPIANPSTGEYIGQALMDYSPVDIRLSLERLTSPLSIVITPDEDATGGDTLIGPNKTVGWESSPIGDLVFLEEDLPNRAVFERDVLAFMKNGESNITHFTRLKNDGTEETLTFSFAPVKIRIVEPMKPDDFASGATLSRLLIYSVGIASFEEVMRRPFEEREDEVYADIERIAIAYLCFVVFLSILLLIFTYRISVYVTRPMITLLRTVRNINSGNTKDDIPPLYGGSSEVHQVYNSFAKLCTIVRVSNTAFFSGNVQRAYHFISDALKLYRKIDDKKAIGIASNNLGNTLYAMRYERARTLTPRTEFDENWTSEAALEHFDEAVHSAQIEFDAETVEELKADFAQQLADRLFNRGLFYLLIREDENAPENAQERGYQDISKARGLDYDVKDLWLERKLLLKNSTAYFTRLIRRIHGLVDFHSDEGLREVWDTKELVEDADQLLFAAWKEPFAPLFAEISRVGRLQQLEAAVIRYEFCTGNKGEAARLAMRMFAEDEYLLECSFIHGATALLGFLRGNHSSPFSSKTVASARAGLRKMLGSCKNSSLDIGKCFVLSLEISERWEDNPILEKINTNCLRLFDEYCGRDDYVGLVAQSPEGELTMELAPKANNADHQRATLDLATLSTSERAFPAFPIAVQMIVDAAASTDNDSYIVLLTDGFSWDSEAYASIKWQIERLNRERNTVIHVIILGVDVEEDAIIEQCKMMTTISKASFYVDVTLETIDEAFDTIVGLLSGHQHSTSCMQGLTMEKF